MQGEADEEYDDEEDDPDYDADDNNNNDQEDDGGDPEDGESTGRTVLAAPTSSTHSTNAVRQARQGWNSGHHRGLAQSPSEEGGAQRAEGV